MTSSRPSSDRPRKASWRADRGGGRDTLLIEPQQRSLSCWVVAGVDSHANRRPPLAAVWLDTACIFWQDFTAGMVW